MANETKGMRGSGRTKIWFIVIAVMVVAIVVVSLTDFPPEGEDVKGAIGAADKYRADQISDEDVVLNETDIQRLLQDDKILALIENKELMNALAEADNALFQAISDFGFDMAMAMSLEAPEALEALRNFRPASMEALRNFRPATMEALRNFRPAELEALRNFRPATMEALRYFRPQVMEALRNFKPAELEALRNFRPATMEALRNARPAFITDFQNA
ncbi:MAG TPA: hypothetical protein ENL22_09410, partial [candidate division Zixibacteria bacterium]|nr:hypothetical protein [candidate division Zixibacteria bacterium]